MGKAALMFVSDIHAKEDKPVCRVDDYINTLKSKLVFISKVQKEHDCTILCPGDIFDKAKPSPFMLSFMLKYLPKMITIPGNHDLPNHNMKMYGKSGLNVLEQAGNVKVIKDSNDLHTISRKELGYEVYVRGIPYGEEFKGQTIKSREITNILMLHTMTYKKELPWKGLEAPKAISLLKKYTDFDIIVTGHNHIPFTISYKGRFLINPGSILRMDADQMDHKPRLYLWYPGTNAIEKIYIPIEKKSINRNHIDIKNMKDKRLEAFISNLKSKYEVGLSFEKNIENFLNKNDINDNIKKIINKAISEEAE